MPAVVVLGMHRAGTSLVANMLQAMGVDMGTDLLPALPSNPHGHFEDVEFLKLNERILRAVGGSWENPPPSEAVLVAGQVLRGEIARLVASKQVLGELWGWKDPRTCLTIPLYHQHLREVRYVVVRRDRDAVVRSLLERSGGSPSLWIGLYDEYERRVEEFLGWCGAPYHDIYYENVVENEHRAWEETNWLAKFVGVTDAEAVDRALATVEFRDTNPGFGKIGFGVPYFKAGYEFWRWWSWLLVDGFEVGDVFLNDGDLPGEVMIPVAHNALVQAFLETDCDTLCIIEDDHVADQDVIRRMRFKERNWAFDIVCASYTARRGIPRTQGATFLKGPTERGYLVNRDARTVALSGTQEYEVAALGLVFIRRWVLEEILNPSAGSGCPPSELVFEVKGRSSQDMDFYWKAKQIGARTGIDRDEWIGHVGQKVWTRQDFVDWFELATAFQEAREAEGGGA